MQNEPRYIYAVVHTDTDYIAYNGKDKGMAVKTAEHAEAHKIPYVIVRGEL